MKEAAAQFQVRKQEPKESVEVFPIDLRILAAKAFPNPDEGMLQSTEV